MTGKRGRRSYSKAFKRRFVAETFEPNASVAAVACQSQLNKGQFPVLTSGIWVEI